MVLHHRRVRFAVVILICWVTAVHAEPVRKKLIEVGGDMPDTQTLRQNLELMEQQPFDGVVLGAIGHVDETKRCSILEAFKDEKWERDWFRPCVEDLRLQVPPVHRQLRHYRSQSRRRGLVR